MCPTPNTTAQVDSGCQLDTSHTPYAPDTNGPGVVHHPGTPDFGLQDILTFKPFGPEIGGGGSVSETVPNPKTDLGGAFGVPIGCESHAICPPH